MLVQELEPLSATSVILSDIHRCYIGSVIREAETTAMIACFHVVQGHDEVRSGRLSHDETNAVCL